MDDELKRYLEAMELRLSDAVAAAKGDLMTLMNNQHERVINDLGTLRRDFTSTKEFLLQDAALRGRQWLDLEERVAKLERKGTGPT